MADHRIYFGAVVIKIKSIPVPLKRVTARSMEPISASLETPCSVSIVMNRLTFDRTNYKTNYVNTKGRKYLTKLLIS